MTLHEAIQIIDAQRCRLRKINGLRFVDGNFEYRIRYEPGFAEFVTIDRRQIGKRNFRYFRGFGAWNCATVREVMERIRDAIAGKPLKDI